MERLLGLALMTVWGCGDDSPAPSEEGSEDTGSESSSSGGEPNDDGGELAFVKLADTEPRCFPNCVADSLTVVDLIQPVCTVVEILAGDFEQQSEVRPCGEDTTGLPNPSKACYVYRSDVNGVTRDDRDDIAGVCRDAGVNLQIRIEIDVNAPPPAGTEYYAGCELSVDPATDCPDLPPPPEDD